MAETEEQPPEYPFGGGFDGLRLSAVPDGLADDDPLVRVRAPYGGMAWLARRWADVRVVLADARLSREATVGKDIPRGFPMQYQQKGVLEMDPPEHSRVRGLVAAAFTARRIAGLRPRIEQTVADLLDAMEAHQLPADLMQALCWPLSITIISDMLGVRPEDRADFRRWSDVAHSVRGYSSAEILDAQRSLRSYIASTVADRRAEPRDDLLTVMVAARDAGDRLTEDELVRFGVLLLQAGFETTANQIGNSVFTLLTEDDGAGWNLLQRDPSVLKTAVGELLRFTPLSAFSGHPRIATEDMEVGGTCIRNGEAVLADREVANRDPRVFESPDALDLGREYNPHLSFGCGPHRCIGAQLAETEIEVALGQLVRRFPDLRLAVPVAQISWEQGHPVRQLNGLPVAW
jgi:cytochrome P450